MLGHLRDRSAGVIGPRALETRLLYDQSLIHRFTKERELEGHHGCVNTLSFSPGGDTLVSGSDDRHVFFWDWQRGQVRCRLPTGHQHNIFQARLMPHTGDKTLVTCAADGQVRVAEIQEGATCLTSKLLFRHGGRAHKLALEPEKPNCFYSCGEDGQVCHYDLRENQPERHDRKLLVCKGRTPGQMRPLDLNSIDINPMRPWQFAVAGGEEWVRIYDQRGPTSTTSSARARGGAVSVAQPVSMLCPWKLRRSRPSYTDLSITCAKYSCTGEIVASYSDEDIYLFSSDGSMGATSFPRNRGPMSPTQPSASKRARAKSPARFDPPPSGSAAHGTAPTPLSPAPRFATRSSTTAATREAGQTLASMGAPSSGAGGEGPHDSVNELAELRVLRQLSRGERQSGDADPALTPGATRRGARSGEADPVLTSQADSGVAGSPGGNPRVVPAAPTGRPLLSRIVRGGNRTGESPGAVRVGSSGRRGPVPDEARASARRGSVRAAPSAEEDEGGGGEGGTFEDRFEEGLSRIQFRRAGPNSAGGNEVTFRLSVEELMNAVHAVSSARQRRDTDFARTISAQGGRVGVAGVSRRPQRGSARPRPRDEDGESDEEEPAGNQEDDYVLRRFSGHRNRRTVKGVNFMGSGDSYVVSGSDCGHIYIWNKVTGRLEQWLKGDDETVNCLEPHPYTMLLATSGLEHSVKVWSPIAAAARLPGRAAEAVMEENASAREEDLHEPEFSFSHFIHQLQRTTAFATRQPTREAERRRGRGGVNEDEEEAEPEEEVEEDDVNDDNDQYEEDDDDVADPRTACSVS